MSLPCPIVVNVTAPAPYYAVGFGVYNSRTGESLPANINVAGYNLTGNINGGAIRINLTSGTYIITVSLSGYISVTFNITVIGEVTYGIGLDPV